jgi:hypothetical protein
MRWLAMADGMGFDIDKIDVHSIPGTFNIPQVKGKAAAKKARYDIDAAGSRYDKPDCREWNGGGTAAADIESSICLSGH